jgi:hypothetical protein
MALNRIRGMLRANRVARRIGYRRLFRVARFVGFRRLLRLGRVARRFRR